MAQYQPGWQNEEFVNQWNEAHPHVVHAPANPNNQINVGNNAQLAQAFQNELNNYRQGLPENQYVIRRHREPAERQAARDAERQHMMEALNLNEQQYEQRNDLARRLRIQQHHQAHPPQHLNAEQRQRRAQHIMYPRIIETPIYDQILQNENIRGIQYPEDERTAEFNHLRGRTLRTLGRVSRQFLQKLFGEFVGLTGFQPEFHPELLTKASAKVYLRDPQETKYRYGLYDMDDDYRTPGTLWIYRVAHDENDANGHVHHVDEEIYSVGGYIVSKSATSKATTNMLRDIHYYRQYPKSSDRKGHNKRDWSVLHGYTTMKPVPSMFRYVSNKIERALFDAGRKLPSVGLPTYIILHDTQTGQPLFDVICKVSTITYNAIISKITQFFLLYYVYPELVNVDARLEALTIDDPPPHGAEAKQFIYNTWKQHIIHPAVEKRLLNNNTIIQAIRDYVNGFNFAGNGHWLPNPYMAGQNQPAIIDCLTSMVVLYFTHNPLRSVNHGVFVDYNALINSSMIYRFCTNDEFNRTIMFQAQNNPLSVFNLTSKATDKVYRELNVHVVGNALVEREDLRRIYDAPNVALPPDFHNNNGGGPDAPGPDDDDSESSSDNGNPAPRRSVNSAVPEGENPYEVGNRTLAREQMNYSTRSDARRSPQATQNILRSESRGRTLQQQRLSTPPSTQPLLGAAPKAKAKAQRQPKPKAKQQTPDWARAVFDEPENQ